jgi:lactate dehydrogenase-like 2-hydroxyacid dehydrogenase
LIRFEGFNMGIKVVVVDGAQLPAGVDFPPLEAAKYGWEQYPALADDDIAERCWRAAIVVALATAIDLTALEKMPRLKLLILAGEAWDGVNHDALEEYGVSLLTFPALHCGHSAEAEHLCQHILQAMDRYLINLENEGKLP